jgi:nitroimidazol reductase NimA-like FMN-containing flavoprotein (pyridoxamine 5'-phosphate oxidase superfamily)
MTKPPSPRTRLRRLHEKAAYDFAAVAAVLDAQPLAHIAHLVDGAPRVTPTLQWRDGDRVYWHGSAASRMVKAATGAEVCLAVSSLDGLVLARSGLEHSVLFRSVMVFGVAEAVTGPEKARQLEVMMDGLVPGRWSQLRPMTAQELKATAVLSLPLTEASVKIGAGHPTDPPQDLDWPVWAGIVPLHTVVGTPEPAPGLAPGLTPPDDFPAFRRS